MSLSYDVVEHFRVDSERMDNYYKERAVRTMQLKLADLLGRSMAGQTTIHELRITVDGRTAVMENNERTAEIEQALKAIRERCEIEVTASYIFYSDAAFENTEELFLSTFDVLEETEHDADVQYALFYKADSNADHGGDVFYYGAHDGIYGMFSAAYEDSDTLPSTGYWYAFNPPVTLDQFECPEEILQDVLKLCETLSTLSVYDNFSVNGNTINYLMSNATLQSEQDIRLFIDTTVELNRLLGFEEVFYGDGYGLMSEFSDLSELGPRMMEIRYPAHGQATVHLAVPAK